MKVRGTGESFKTASFYLYAYFTENYFHLWEIYSTNSYICNSES